MNTDKAFYRLPKKKIIKLFILQEHLSIGSAVVFEYVEDTLFGKIIVAVFNKKRKKKKEKKKGDMHWLLPQTSICYIFVIFYNNNLSKQLIGSCHYCRSNGGLVQLFDIGGLEI